MGAVGLNGAAAAAADPVERLRLSSKGWARWAPTNIVAVGAHAIGGLGLLAANRSRIAAQPSARAAAVTKTALTGVAAAVTAYSGLLGRRTAQHAGEGTAGATEPAESASEALAAAQRKLRVAQWGMPVLTGALIVLGALQGEQQRPQSLLRAQLSRAGI